MNRLLFSRVFSFGKRHHTPHFQTIYQDGAPAFSIVIPKKVLKKATDRNALKRRISGVLEEMSLDTGRYIFIAKKPITTLTHAELADAVRTSVGLCGRTG